MATRILALCVVGVMLQGCVMKRFIQQPSFLLRSSPKGIIYNQSVVTKTTNFDNTPVGSKVAETQSHKIKEPFSGVGLSVEWNQSVVMNAAKSNGLKDVYFLDTKTFSILGYYVNKRVLIYGD